MAAEHERWIVALTAGLDGADRARLHALLGKLKTTLASGGGAAREPPAGGGGR
jgi:hypothetical protein